MKRILKTLSTSFVAMMMVLSSIGLVKAEDLDTSFEPTDSYYAIVNAEGKALSMQSKDNTVPNADNNPMMTGVIENDETSDNGIGFNVIKNSNDTYTFYNPNKGNHTLEKEPGAGDVFSYFVYDSNKTQELLNRTPSQFKLVVSGTGYKIYSVGSSEYLYEKDKRLYGTTDDSKADTFYINPVNIIDTSHYIQSLKTKKYVRFDGVGKTLKVDADDNTNANTRWISEWGTFDGSALDNKNTLAIYSKDGTARWQGGNVDTLMTIAGKGWGGWESITVEPNGDGVSFKSQTSKKYFVEKNGEIVADSEEKPGIEGQFAFYNPEAPDAVTNLDLVDVDQDMIEVTFDKISNKNIYSGYQVVAENENTNKTIESKATTDNTVKLNRLEKGTTYKIYVKTLNSEFKAGISDAIRVKILSGAKPGKTDNVEAKLNGTDITVTFDEVEGATSYDIYKAESAYSNEYEKVATVDTNKYVDANIDSSKKYEQYYKVKAVNDNGTSALSDDFGSLEETKFGKNMYFFFPKDDINTVNEIIQNVFDKQNDFSADAQFNTNRYAFYFKKGNYTSLNCINLGFYTSINGLGKLPTDVSLNNIAIPAYLPAGELGGDGNNATCNFWRSAENVSIINTGNEQGKAGYGSWRPEAFNWAVAQAAPLRRVYSEREVDYDWNYGWASGGYVADSKFTNVENSAGTWSGQQFYTRNSDLTGNGFGCTLNNFYQGVNAPNIKSGQDLTNKNGTSNWNDGESVVTNITYTEKIREKPFLYLDDDGEYKVFVPSIRTNAKGTSWSDNNMGEGKSYSIEDFYVAKEGDSAQTINEQLESKNVFFTPGIYKAEKVINVKRANTIVLGTGMASIIPDNSDAAMRVADVDGVTVAGLIFDAGTKNSDLLLEVGEKTGTSHASNPTLLADLFFRVGGTTNEVTNAKDALVINSNDVLTDHFWIWRADHGTGVAWNGNPSDHGLIVNGDNVICYALFNEHFKQYDTLWNGENGKTYFYQNEKCYDPINQDAWMADYGKSNGYAAYKVANTVKKHYAVGLGVYNVFIYAGGTDSKLGDSSNVEIQLENAVEVPNTEGVLIENVVVQTFADNDKAYQAFNHVINGTGDGVSSGKSLDGTKEGTGWTSHRGILYYCNGKSISLTDGQTKEETGYKPYDVEGENDYSELFKAYEECLVYDENDYTPESYKPYKEIMDEVKPVYDENKKSFSPTRWTQEEIDEKAQLIRTTYKNLEKVAADVKALNEAIEKANEVVKSDDYKYLTDDSKEALDKALKEATDLDQGSLKKDDQEKVDAIAKALEEAIKNVAIKDADYSKLKEALNKAKDVVDSANYKNNKYVDSTVKAFDEAYQEAKEVKDNLNAKDQAIIDAKVKILNNAINGLTVKPAKTDDLEDLIKKAEDVKDTTNYKNGNYSNANDLDKALTNAVKALKETDQDKVDNAYKDLYNAINNLKLKNADYKNLDKLLKKAEKITKSSNYTNKKYTTDSLNAFKQAYKNAKAVDKDLKVTSQAAIDAVADALEDAIDDLSVKDSDSVIVVGDNDNSNNNSNSSNGNKNNTKIKKYYVKSNGKTYNYYYTTKVVKEYVNRGSNPATSDDSNNTTTTTDNGSESGSIEDANNETNNGNDEKDTPVTTTETTATKADSHWIFWIIIVILALLLGLAVGRNVKLRNEQN